jgi:hypothetical protein
MRVANPIRGQAPQFEYAQGGAAASGTSGQAPVDITASRSFDMAQV